MNLPPVLSQGAGPIRHKSLSAYFPRLYTLGSLLEQCVNATSHALCREADPLEYRELLLQSICAISDEDALRLPCLEPAQRGVGPSHAEVVDNILHELARRTYPRAGGSGTCRDALLAGLTSRSDPNLPINPSKPSFEHRYASSPSTVLRTLPWKILRLRIGNEAFRWLLMQTSVFLSVGNSCYLQLSGRPLHELYKHDQREAPKPSDGKARVVSSDRLRVKRRKTAKDARDAALTGAVQAEPELRNARSRCADRAILRGKMFYGTPSRTGKGRIMYGLPAAHILNQLIPTSSPTDTSPLILLRAIFPTSTSNLFASPGYVPPQQLTSEHFKLCGSQTRLQPLLGFTRELIARHRAYDYAAAARRCMERMPGDDESSDQSVKLEDGSATPLRAVTHRNVERFVGDWMRGVLNGDMIGEANVGVLIRHAKALIRLNQYEPVNLHNVMQGLSITSIPCLSNTREDGEAQQRRTACVERKNRAIAEDLVYGIFNDLLIPLLRNTFYVTETASTRYSTMYFLHEHWAEAAGPHFATLERDLLESLPLNSKLIKKDDAYFAKHSTLGVAAVRLVPKPNGGFRPIVNLGKRINPKPPSKTSQGFYSSQKGDAINRAYNSIPIHPNTPAHPAKRNASGMKSANQILRDVHQILMYERERNRPTLGNTLFGTNEVFAPIRDLKQDLIWTHGKVPHLYFVKMDIKAAFDTIDQDKMLQVIEDLLDKSHDYCLILYALLLPPASKASQGSSRRLFKTKAMSDGDTSVKTDFGSHARTLAAPLRNAVLVDLMRRKRVSKEKCLELLRAHVKQNVWQMDGKLLRQRQGIPQGSKVSSLLCSFFYAAMEREHLGFIDVPGTKLLRYIDDFLLITPSIDIAHRFVRRMNDGFPKYGAYVSRGKTLLSFECLGEGKMEEVCVQGDWFPYCGFMINTATLDVSMDTARSLSGPIRQSFSLRANRHIGSSFVGWFSRQLENRNHVAYHNSLNTVGMNVFLNFALTGLKVPFYFARWSSGAKLRRQGTSARAMDEKNGSRDMPRRQLGKKPRGREQEDAAGGDVERRAGMIADSLRAAIDYTYVAGRARVKHIARVADQALRAKASSRFHKVEVDGGGIVHNHADTGDTTRVIRPGKRKMGDDYGPVRDSSPARVQAGDEEQDMYRAKRPRPTLQREASDRVQDQDEQVERKPDIAPRESTMPLQARANHYAFPRSEFTFIALSALCLCIQRKRSDTLWQAVLSELEKQIQSARRAIGRRATAGGTRGEAEEGKEVEVEADVDGELMRVVKLGWASIRTAR